MGNETKWCKSHGKFYRHKQDLSGCYYPFSDECAHCEQEHTRQLKPYPSGRRKAKPRKKNQAEKNPQTPASEKPTMSLYTWLPAGFSTIRPLPWNSESYKQVVELLKTQGAHTINDDTPKNSLGLPVGYEIKAQLQLYNEGKNPVYLLEAFVTAYQNGLYPPESVLKKMADIFETYLEAWGEKSLDDLFGFRKKNTGKGRPRIEGDAFLYLAQKDREERIFLMMIELTETFDIVPKLKLLEAAKMVCARLRLKQSPWTLVQNFSRNGGSNKNTPSIQRLFSERTEDDKKAVLLCYPTNTIPRRLRTKYKIK